MLVTCILWFRRLACCWKIRPGNYLTKKQVCWPFVQSCTISSWRLRSTAFATYYRCRWFQEETQRDWSREVCNSHQMIQRAWTFVHYKNSFFQAGQEGFKEPQEKPLGVQWLDGEVAGAQWAEEDQLVQVLSWCSPSTSLPPCQTPCDMMSISLSSMISSRSAGTSSVFSVCIFSHRIYWIFSSMNIC